MRSRIKEYFTALPANWAIWVIPLIVVTILLLLVIVFVPDESSFRYGRF